MALKKEGNNFVKPLASFAKILDAVPKATAESKNIYVNNMSYLSLGCFTSHGAIQSPSTCKFTFPSSSINLQTLISPALSP